MSEMYKYLQEHNYISKNKNKDPFKQQELSKERAEAIANKCDNLLQQKENIIKEIREYLPKLRVCPSYELDEKIDNLEEILDKENK